MTDTSRQSISQPGPYSRRPSRRTADGTSYAQSSAGQWPKSPQVSRQPQTRNGAPLNGSGYGPSLHSREMPSIHAEGLNGWSHPPVYGRDDDLHHVAKRYTTEGGNYTGPRKHNQENVPCGDSRLAEYPPVFPARAADQSRAASFGPPDLPRRHQKSFNDGYNETMKRLLPMCNELSLFGPSHDGASARQSRGRDSGSDRDSHSSSEDSCTSYRRDWSPDLVDVEVLYTDDSGYEPQGIVYQYREMRSEGSGSQRTHAAGRKA